MQCAMGGVGAEFSGWAVWDAAGLDTGERGRGAGGWRGLGRWRQRAQAVADLGKKLSGRVMLWVHCLLRVCFPAGCGFLGWRGGGCWVGVGVRSGFLGGNAS